MTARAVFKWAGFLLAGLLALVAVVLLVVWAWGGAIIAKSYPVEERGFDVAAYTVDLEHGERLARVTGCMDGCHGKGAAGRVFFEAPFVVRLVAPNLTTAVRENSDADLEAMIRQGVRPDGRSLWVMPSAAFAHMSDADLASVIAYLRRAPASPNDPGESSYGPVGRYEMIRAEMIRPEAELAAGIEAGAAAPGGGAAHGAYLATLACAECHGPDMGGRVGFSPTLEIAKSYDLEQFTRLLREGTALGDREVGLMSEVARGRFKHFSDTDIADLHAYFQAR